MELLEDLRATYHSLLLEDRMKVRSELKLMYDGGDLIGQFVDSILRTVDQSLHTCDVCGLTPLPQGHPHCATCEAATLLKKCEYCQKYWCSTPHASSDCFRWHECAQIDGPCHEVTRG